ncbi:MAG: cupin domain-containing protein [Candidatus Tectomicrobia bacterium]|nr:cupin domain-containing protein [Candidatus Tectomicrobia bacterium]
MDEQAEATQDSGIVRLDDVIEFSVEKRIRKRIFRTDDIVTELLCYEPGQGTPMHHHIKEDEVYYVLQGRGTFTVGERKFRCQPRGLYLVPKMVKHGIENDADERLVMIFFKKR